MITDEQIEKRAEELAHERFPGCKYSVVHSDAGLFTEYRIATIERLKDARKSLMLLEVAREIHVRDNPDEEDDPSVFMDRIDAHIAHLKKLLGI